jgi:hypothetical protein
MRGARQFQDAEIEQIVLSFRGRYAVRDKALFILGLSTVGLKAVWCMSVTS